MDKNGIPYPYTADDTENKKGYVIAVCDDSDFYIPNAVHIERNDSLKPWVYKDDAEAAKGAEQDGIKLIYGMKGVSDGVYIDSPENRELIRDYFIGMAADKGTNNKPSILGDMKEKTAQISTVERNSGASAKKTSRAEGIE